MKPTLLVILLMVVGIQGAAQATVTYHNGEVLPHPHVYPVMMGPSISYRTEFNRFMKSLVKGPYMGVLAEWSTATQRITYGSVEPEVVDYVGLAPATVAFGDGKVAYDSDVQARLQSLLAAGSLPRR